MDYPKEVTLSFSTFKKVNKHFPDGSEFSGEFDVDMNGRGVYTYADGTEYRGQFRRGSFHGQGRLITTTNFVAAGEFKDGRCIEAQFKFNDELEFRPRDWGYLTSSDRRYACEIAEGIKPVGNSYETKEKVARKIPKGYYDYGEGFFNPINGALYSAETGNYIRNVTKNEWEWIMDNCRNTHTDKIGYEEFILRDNLNAMKEINDILDCACEMSDDVDIPIEYT